MPLWGTHICDPMTLMSDIHRNHNRFSWGLGGVGEHDHSKTTLASDLNLKYSRCHVSYIPLIFSHRSLSVPV